MKTFLSPCPLSIVFAVSLSQMACTQSSAATSPQKTPALSVDANTLQQGEAKVAQASAEVKTVATKKPTGTAIDHTLFDGILKATVKDGLVDYQLIRKAHLKSLSDYLTLMSGIDETTLSQDERFAFYLNVYNATVLLSIGHQKSESYTVEHNKFALFKRKIVSLKRGKVSLDTLEKKITWDAFHDPRMHVGFVCGAMSCPPLIDRAFTGSTVQKQLDENMKRFLADPSRNSVDKKAKTLHLSKIFEWYASDFGDVPRYLEQVNEWGLKDVPAYKLKFREYDWALNQKK